MQAINQLISIISSGQVVGGMFKGEDKSQAAFYYKKDGVFYVGSGANGGPADMDEDITEEELRRRLEGHFNSLPIEEVEEDSAYIERMYTAIQQRANTTAVAMSQPVAMTPAEQSEGITISTNQAYNLLHLMDELGTELYIDGPQDPEFMEAVEAIRSLYRGLPSRQQKDIEELDLYRDIIEE